MVPNLLTTLQNMDETHFWENMPLCGATFESRRCKPADNRKTIKKKAKRVRTAYTTEQIRALELIFTENKYITPERRRAISQTLKIGDKSVKIWFQNRRMKEKRESSESGSDSSNETLADDGSLAPIASKEFCDPNNTVNKEFSPEPNQYQVPFYYPNDTCNQQTQGLYANDFNIYQVNMNSREMQIYSDSNLYPTQYYPYNGDNYVDEYSCTQNQQGNAIDNGYWNSNNEVSYFYYN